MNTLTHYVSFLLAGCIVDMIIEPEVAILEHQVTLRIEATDDRVKN